MGADSNARAQREFHSTLPSPGDVSMSSTNRMMYNRDHVQFVYSYRLSVRGKSCGTMVDGDLCNRRVAIRTANRSISKPW